MILVSVAGSAVGLCPLVLDPLMAVLYKQGGSAHGGQRYPGDDWLTGDQDGHHGKKGCVLSRLPLFLLLPFSVSVCALLCFYSQGLFLRPFPVFGSPSLLGTVFTEVRRRDFDILSRSGCSLDAQEWLAPALCTC